jgi:beta-lactamase superfamily II metal-dependent hydrolase
MRVTAFHAGDGDCLLVSSGDTPPRHVLVDGGRKTSYEQNTRDAIRALRAAGQQLDVVCVSHIDDDHISGILRLVEDEVEWRAFEFAHAEDAAAPEPSVARPPALAAIWHNGLFRLVGDDIAPAVESVLATVSTVLAGSPREDLRERAAQLDDIVTGERASMELSRRLSPDQLGIALNPPTGGLLMKRGTAAPAPHERVALGSLTLSLLGPSDDDIDKLRASWQAWIDKSQASLRELQQRMLADEERLGTLSPLVVANPMLDQALGEGLADVTEANLASLMFLVEEGSTTALLTGDGVSSEILEGLQHHGRLDANGRVHVNLLKVQHHGAKANVDETFVQHVTADHYVFCGNGSHDNPEIEVVEAFANARLQGFGGSAPIGPPTPFKFWFTSAPTTPGLSEPRRKHMQAVKDTVARLRTGHQSRLLAPTFLKNGSFAIEL